MEDGFHTISIIGVGLIGGSLALALKEKGLTKKIIGYGRNEERLKKALALGIIDRFTTSIKEACEAETVVLATPVGIFGEIVKEMVNYLKKGTIVFDVGSVKEAVVKNLEKMMPEGVHFVGTHPIAGSEKAGFEHARGDLFKGSKVIITPTEKTERTAVEKVSLLWQKVGASVEFMNAEEHDRIYATVSHLPHLVSFCLVSTVSEIDKNFIKYAGSGFKSSTRIAKSSPELWKDIFILNRKNIISCLDIFTHKLEELRRLISQKNSEELKKFLEVAKELREKIN